MWKMSIQYPVLGFELATTWNVILFWLNFFSSNKLNFANPHFPHFSHFVEICQDQGQADNRRWANNFMIILS